MDPKLPEMLVCPVTKGPLTFDREKQELISKSARLGLSRARRRFRSCSRKKRASSPQPNTNSAAACALGAHFSFHRPDSGALRVDAPAGQTARRYRRQADGRARRGTRWKARATRVVVATDDMRVRDAVRCAWPRGVTTTRGDHATGTDRLAEARATAWPRR